MEEAQRARYIRVAGLVALLGNTSLAIMKFILGHLASSLAVTGDAIDSSTDVLIALVTLLISFIIRKPSDKEHPWGHGRAETTATMILSFIIFFAGSQLIVQSLKKISDYIKDPLLGSIDNAALISSIISICGKAFLSLLLYKLGTKANSDMTKANAANMRNDIILSAAILIGVAAAKFFSCPVLDPLAALLAGMWIIKNALSLFVQINMELMDGNTDNSLYSKLFKAIDSVPGAENPHRARIRKIASLFDIDLDIEVDPNLTVYEAHEIAEAAEDAVREAIPETYAVMIHIEPCGSETHQRKEEFGLRPEDV